MKIFCKKKKQKIKNSNQKNPTTKLPTNKLTNTIKVYIT